MSLAHLTAACLLLSCSHVPTVGSASRLHLAGRVLRADGAPATGAVVIVSDPRSGEELAAAHAGEEGRFAMDVTATIVTVTATTIDQSAYLAGAAADRGPVEVRLASGCSRFEGHVDTVAPIPAHASVRLGGLGEAAGRVYGATVARDGRFAACLPAATYYVQEPDGFAPRNALASLPGAHGFRFRTDPRTFTDRTPRDLTGISPESAEAFVTNIAASTKVLGLGESNHGTREFYEERTALAMALARRHDFRLILLEAGYGEALALDDYINGRELDPAAAVQRLGYWIWDTNTFLSVLDRLRSYNAGLPAERHIHVVGVDVQTTSGAIELLQRSASAALTPRARALLERLVERNGGAWTKLLADERDVVRAALGRVAKRGDAGGPSSLANREALAARSLQLALAIQEEADAFRGAQMRDAGMAQMALDVLALDPTNRATLWAHLGHVGREYNVGMRTMGEALTARLGAGYQVVGLLAVAGSARAWDADYAIGVISQALPVAPAYSLEAVLSSRSGGAHVSYWSFARATGEAAKWMNGVRALRTFGSVFPRAGNEFWYWDLRSFDGAILFDRVTPTDPTPTGERRAAPREPGAE